MKFKVEITAWAEAELKETYEWIRKESPRAANEWRKQLIDKVKTLKSFPNRCPLAPENGVFKMEIRQLIQGNYRFLFTIGQKTVYILHIRRQAREQVEPE